MAYTPEDLKDDLTELPRLEISQYKAGAKQTWPLMIGIPTTGVVRFEWHLAMSSLVIPVCFSVKGCFRPIRSVHPIGYHVAEARNLIVRDFLKSDCEWLFFVDHDVLPHPYTYGYMRQHMQRMEYPIVSGLYFSKGEPSEPLVFRGRGAGPFLDWKLGDIVPVDGVVMGCTIIHRSILETYWKICPRTVRTRDGQELKELFRSPRDLFIDPENLKIGTLSGTEDLYFCEQVMRLGVLEKAGWKKLANDPYPFLTDTRIFCRHIDMTGRQFPLDNPFEVKETERVS